MDLTMPAMDGAECVAKLVQRDPELRIWDFGAGRQADGDRRPGKGRQWVPLQAFQRPAAQRCHAQADRRLSSSMSLKRMSGIH
jgi:CheY-like chemotaxis protein